MGLHNIPLWLSNRPRPLRGFNFLGELPTGMTFARDCNATLFDETGTMVSVAANVPRFDHDPATGEPRGLLQEEQRTNFIRNSVCSGAVAGSPGTLPTYWNGSSSGLTRTIVGTGVEYGIPYVEIRAAGTATGTQWQIRLENEAGIPASTNDYFAVSVYYKIVSGSIGSPSLQILEYDSGSNYLATRTVSTNLSSGDRIAGVIRTTSATVAYARPILIFPMTGGNGYDFTVRVYGPQCELGRTVTSLIPTTGAAATRVADQAYFASTSPWYNATEGTLVMETMVPYSAPRARSYMASFTDGTSNTLEGGFYETDGTPTGGAVISGTAYLSGQALDTVTAYTIVKSALAYRSGNNQFATNGVLDTAGDLAALAVPSGMDELWVGNRTALDRALNGWVRSIKYYPRRLSNVELQRMTT